MAARMVAVERRTDGSDDEWNWTKMVNDSCRNGDAFVFLGISKGRYRMISS